MRSANAKMRMTDVVSSLNATKVLRLNEKNG